MLLLQSELFIPGYMSGRREQTGTLLQGVNLPPKVSVADASFPELRQLPSIPVFKERENREGEALIRQRVGGKAGSAQNCPPSDQPGLFSQAPVPASFLYPQTDQPPSSAWSYCEQNQMPQVPSTSLGFCYGPQAPVLTSFGQGQFPPLPSPLAPLYRYYTPPLQSSTPTAAAGSASSSPSDQISQHESLYCPASGQSILEWKASLGKQ